MHGGAWSSENVSSLTRVFRLVFAASVISGQIGHFFPSASRIGCHPDRA